MFLFSVLLQYQRLFHCELNCFLEIAIVPSKFEIAPSSVVFALSQAQDVVLNADVTSSLSHIHAWLSPNLCGNNAQYL